MSKIDIGIVIIPDEKCKKLAEEMKQEACNLLTNHIPLKNNTHVTLYHISNVPLEKISELKSEFNAFVKKYSSSIKFPILGQGFKATGGDLEEGYKWLDLQFETIPNLIILREDTLKIFSKFHNGKLERMNDDYAQFTDNQKAQIDTYGVTVYPYLPHVTTYYINLPIESKTPFLEQVANSLQTKYSSKEEYREFQGEYLALVELGRNGNALNVIELVSLAGESEVMI